MRFAGIIGCKKKWVWKEKKIQIFFNEKYICGAQILEILEIIFFSVGSPILPFFSAPYMHRFLHEKDSYRGLFVPNRFQRQNRFGRRIFHRKPVGGHMNSAQESVESAARIF